MSPPVCKVFSYTMVEDAPQFENILWACEGQVMYQSSHFTTEWHGTYREVGHGVIQLAFHFKGNTRKPRTTNVVEVMPGVYRGRDYKRRMIEMVLIETIEHSPDNGWLVVGDLRRAIEDIAR